MTKQEVQFVFEQIQELALFKTSKLDVLNVLNLTIEEFVFVLRENNTTYSKLLKKQASVAVKSAKDIMFNSVFNIPDASVGDKQMAKEVVKMHSESEKNAVIRKLQKHFVNINAVERISLDEEYNSFLNCLEYTIIINPSSNYAVTTNNVVLKYKTSLERDNIADLIQNIIEEGSY
jgi:hypothetical protein